MPPINRLKHLRWKLWELSLQPPINSLEFDTSGLDLAPNYALEFRVLDQFSSLPLRDLLDPLRPGKAFTFTSTHIPRVRSQHRARPLLLVLHAVAYVLVIPR